MLPPEDDGEPEFSIDGILYGNGVESRNFGKPVCETKITPESVWGIICAVDGLEPELEYVVSLVRYPDMKNEINHGLVFLRIDPLEFRGGILDRDTATTFYFCMLKTDNPNFDLTSIGKITRDAHRGEEGQLVAFIDQDGIWRSDKVIEGPLGNSLTLRVRVGSNHLHETLNAEAAGLYKQAFNSDDFLPLEVIQDFSSILDELYLATQPETRARAILSLKTKLDLEDLDFIGLSVLVSMYSHYTSYFDAIRKKQSLMGKNIPVDVIRFREFIVKRLFEKHDVEFNPRKIDFNEENLLHSWKTLNERKQLVYKNYGFAF